MIKTKHIDRFVLGQQIYSFCQAIYKENKVSKNGDAYIDLTLRDITGSINGKIWRFVEHFDTQFNEGDLIAVKGKIKKYRKKLFLEVEHLSLLNPNRYKKFGFTTKIIHPSIDSSADKLFSHIIKSINTLNSPYKDILVLVYKKYEKEIKIFPDDLQSNSYCKRGSLIQKKYNALNILLSLKKYTDAKNIDLLISGILLKYIGRIKQFKFDIVFSYSDVGTMESCSILSRDIIKEAASKCNVISKSQMTELIDVVLCDNFYSETNGDIINFIFSLEKCFFN